MKAKKFSALSVE